MGLDGADRALHRPGHLGLGQVVEIAQDHDVPLLGREREQRSLEVDPLRVDTGDVSDLRRERALALVKENPTLKSNAIAALIGSRRDHVTNDLNCAGYRRRHGRWRGYDGRRFIFIFFVLGRA